MFRSLRVWSVCLVVLVSQAPQPAWAAEEPAKQPAQAKRPPNIVLFYCDDLGYADPSCYGGKTPTPNIDRLAKEGMRFTDAYTAAAVCSASRAGLLTGCYPQRVSILGALNPKSKIGIHADEVLLPEILKSRGYKTAIFGKWHLGHLPPFLPTKHGFDEYFGLPYSNDMWPKHPGKIDFPELPLFDGDKVIKEDPDQTQLTTWYTERAVKFLEQHQSKPFFLYVPHSMPHVPLFVSAKFAGKSKQGIYGDVLMEIDWSVGQVLDKLKELKLDDNTLVIFSSDNGPWLAYGDHGGSAGHLREGKQTTWDGGQRIPLIARWPGIIPTDKVSSEPVMTLDLLPTLAKLAGGEAPKDRIIDGRDIWPLLAGEKDAKSPHEFIYFYWNRRLDGVRSGKWKLVLPHPYPHIETPGKEGKPGKTVTQKTELALYDLEKDPGEQSNLASSHADIVARLQKYVEQAREDLGDETQKRKGKNIRPAGQVD